jgi:hypothetical protein
MQAQLLVDPSPQLAVGLHLIAQPIRHSVCNRRSDTTFRNHPAGAVTRQGNTLWTGEACMGMVDWDAAGVGHPGIDLGSLRCDAAIMFGLPAAAEILDGWRQASGLAADTVGVLGPGGRADHPDRHGAMAAAGPRPRPCRPRHPDP